MPAFEEFSEDLSFLVKNFAPVETSELPDYTSLAEFNLGNDTIDDSHPENPEASKFIPCSSQERLSLIRQYLGLLAGDDAKLVGDEFLINGEEAEQGKDVPQVTHLSVGTLATGETVVVATDTSPGMIANPRREKSINLAAIDDNDEPLKGAALDAVLVHTGQSGRGFMISSGLAVDHQTHLTPAHDVHGNVVGKHLWAILPGVRRDQMTKAA